MFHYTQKGKKKECDLASATPMLSVGFPLLGQRKEFGIEKMPLPACVQSFDSHPHPWGFCLRHGV